MEIVKIDSPDYKTQRVMVHYRNGHKKSKEVHTSTSNDFYILIGPDRLYLKDTPDGEWLEQMLR